jgi:transcriptional regulator with XRE-family HTH domain
VTEEDVSSAYAQRVGERLRAVRKQKRLSLQAVEAGSDQEFKASVLGAYERGERAISVPRLQKLARFYQVPVDQLLPREANDPDGSDETIDLRARSRGDSGERVTIDLTRMSEMEEREREMLTRYLSFIQLQRQDFNGRMLTIRHEDLVAIGCMLDTTAEGIRRRLDDLGLRINA